MIENSNKEQSNRQHPTKREAIEAKNDLTPMLTRLNSGDAQAFDELFQMYQVKLLNFVKSSLQESADAEEIVQDTFLKIWDKRSQIDPNKNISAFLYTIAKNEINDYLRKSLNKKKYINTVLSDNLKVYNDVEHKIEFRETERILNKLVDQLPEKRRNVFLQSRFYGKTYRQIAKELNISENTVDTQIRKALAFLKDRWLKINELSIIVILSFLGGQ